MVGWAFFYSARWPELLEKQLEDYADAGINWRQVAREHVIPFWEERLPTMKRAHENLLEIITPIHRRAQEVLNFERAVTYVIYVGIGCGAGWATQYEDSAAVLFGLENIAEEGWEDATTLKSLASHEIGHLWHFEKRAQAGLPSGEGPWWDLYTEGMAQRCEHLIAGEESWHMTAQNRDWLDWCRQEESWLAQEFLNVVEAGEDTRIFFGSWFDVRGYKQTGYYLGHEVVRWLEAQMSLTEIATLEDIEAQFFNVLTSMTKL
jgi:hypothetical protein